MAKNPLGSGGLSFGGFISCYLLAKGVKERASFAVIFPMDRISPASLRRSRGQLKRVEVPLLETGEPSDEPTQQEPLSDTQPQVPPRPSEEHSLEGLVGMVRRMGERQEAMFQELKERQDTMFEDLKTRQAVVHAGLIKMNRIYKGLDNKVDQLFESSSEGAPPFRDEPTDAEVAEAEACMQDQIAFWQRQAPAPPHTGAPADATHDGPDTPAVPTPEEAATTEPVPDASHPNDPATSIPAIDPSAAIDPSPEHISDGSTEECTSADAPDPTE